MHTTFGSGLGTLLVPALVGDHLFNQGCSLGNRKIKIGSSSKLSQLPSALQQLEAEKHEQARQAYQLHKSLQPIPGSIEADIKEVQEADGVRLCVIMAIQNTLGSLQYT